MKSSRQIPLWGPVYLKPRRSPLSTGTPRVLNPSTGSRQVRPVAKLSGKPQQRPCQAHGVPPAITSLSLTSSSFAQLITQERTVPVRTGCVIAHDHRRRLNM